MPENANLDDYKTPGSYYCVNFVTADTIVNNPFPNVPFILKVEYGQGTNYPVQTFQNMYGTKIARRMFNTDTGGGKWQPFVYFSDDATLLGQITNLKHKNINYGNITIPSSGYISWAETDVGSPNDQIDGTVLFATIYNWGSNGGHCFNVTEQYCIGEANMTITNINVRFWYVE